MQLVGTQCEICDSRITADADGTWCAQCHSKFHRACLDEHGDRCNKCQDACTPAESLFYYSTSCPECMARVGHKVERCGECNTRTRWDTEEDYLGFKEIHLSACRRMRLRGWCEIVLGIGLCCFFVALVLMIEVTSFIIAWGLPLALGIASIADGVCRMRRGKCLSKFA